MSDNVISFIDLKTQYRILKSKIDMRIQCVLEHGQYIMGPEVKELEDKLKDYVGTKHCITVASGTDALLISLMALGIGPGDEVITTPFTFASTVEVIVLLGATPVFVDIQAETCNIDATLIEKKITHRTKAIIPVSLYGQPSDMDLINLIANAYGGIPVIEDGAQSFGATYKGRKSGNLSTIGCTSFFPSKPLGCYGDGGAIFTNDDEIAEICRQIRIHGQSKRYFHSRIGIAGRMDTLQCAIILAKLDNFDWEIAQRQKIAELYHHSIVPKQKEYSGFLVDKLDTESHEYLAHLALWPDLVIPLPLPKDDISSVFAQYTILVNRRDILQDRLNSVGIPTVVHYPVPINEQPAYRDMTISNPTPIAHSIAKKVISLPMSPYLREDELHRITSALQAC